MACQLVWKFDRDNIKVKIFVQSPFSASEVMHGFCLSITYIACLCHPYGIEILPTLPEDNPYLSPVEQTVYSYVQSLYIILVIVVLNALISIVLFFLL